MTGTEIDEGSFSSANKNVQKNSFQHLIDGNNKNAYIMWVNYLKLQFLVVLVDKKSILKEIIKENSSYSFVMCNPPFFETDKGLGKKSKAEPPRNAPTGNSTELEVEGGEREFILPLMDESLIYNDKVKIYTTMFGQKSSLSFLRKELSKRGIFTQFGPSFAKDISRG